MKTSATAGGSPADPAAPVRILVENGEYWLRNHGDLAMLTVTLSRLRARWPDSRIAVLTDVPALLRAYFPDIEAITAATRQAWAEPRQRRLRLERLGPRVAGPLALARLRLRAQLGRVARLRRRGRWFTSPDTATGPARSGEVEQPAEQPVVHPLPAGVASAVRDASLVVALGGGYLTDADPAQATRALDLLEHACDLGVPTVMVGQGLGPLEDSELRRRAAEVLPKVDFIALREERRGPDILRRAGVRSDRFLVTGDDAIELARAARRVPLGSALGLCLRTSTYTPLQRASQETVGRVVRRAAELHDARLVPIIISEHPSEDRAGTLPLLRGATSPARPLPRFERPSRVAERVASCRIVVTGAYHLAVFALSQGIPVVALTSSAYYDDKFLGLGDMFGSGLALVRLNTSSTEAELSDAVHASWDLAPLVRAELRDRADRQVETSRDGYRRVFALVEPEPPASANRSTRTPRAPVAEPSGRDR